MKESYSEGIANHAVPESCGGTGNGIPEALTGEKAGWVLSSEKDGKVLGADALLTCGRQHRDCRYRETGMNPAESETPGMHRHSLHGTREIPRFSTAKHAGERAENPKGVPPR